MLYDDVEKEMMANAIQKNMRTSSPAVLKAITDTIDGYLSIVDFKGAHILDIGPGQCDFLDIAKARGAVTYGVDFDPAVLKLGEKRGHIMADCNLLSGWPYKDVKFDGVFCRASINCFWFTEAGGTLPLQRFLENISGSLKPGGWMWLLPWNNFPENEGVWSLAVRTTIEQWARKNSIRVDVVGRDEKKRFGFHYSLPYLETWTRNCASSMQRDLTRAARWNLPTNGRTESSAPNGLYSVYENSRKRTLVGTTVAAEQDAASKTLEDPVVFLTALAKAEGGGAEEVAAAYAALIASRPRSDVLYAYLQARIVNMTQARLYKAPGTKARTYAWGWTYWGRAAVLAFQATEERRFVDLVLDGYERLLNERDDSLEMQDASRKRVTKCWGVHTPEESPMRAFEVTSTGLMLLPVCDLLLCEAAKGLSTLCRDRLIASITECLDEFDGEMLVDESTNGGYFRAPFDQAVEALNHTHALGTAFVKAYQLTGKAKYLNDAERIANYFRASWTREENGTLSWPYAPTPDRMKHDHPPMSSALGNVTHRIGGEAFFKACVTAEFPIAATEAGVCFQKEDIERIAEMFLKNVLQPGNEVNMYISARKIRPGAEVADKYQAQFALIGAFSLLDSVRPEVRARLVELIGAKPSWFPLGWFSGPATAMALCRLFANTKQRLDD